MHNYTFCQSYYTQSVQEGRHVYLSAACQFPFVEYGLASSNSQNFTLKSLDRWNHSKYSKIVPHVWDQGKPYVGNYKTDVFHGRGNRTFFFSTYKQSYVYSIYTPVYKHLVKSEKPGETNYMDCLIILLNNHSFAIGQMLKGKMVYHHVIDRADTPGTRRITMPEFWARIHEVLQVVKQHILYEVPVIFASCSMTDYINIIQKGLSTKKVEITCCEVEHIPFRIIGGNPSYDMLGMTYYKLLCCECHGTKEQFRESVVGKNKLHNSEFEWMEKKEEAETRVEEFHENKQKDYSFVSNNRKDRKIEKSLHPGLSKDLKNKIHDAIKNNNYEHIIKIYERNDLDSEIFDYLSKKHDKLNGLTFMHYTVIENLDDSLVALLEIGCDPTVKDSEGKVPFEYCTEEFMKEIFYESRNENPDEFDWESFMKVPRKITWQKRRKSYADYGYQRKRLRSKRLQQRKVFVEDV